MFPWKHESQRQSVEAESSQSTDPNEVAAAGGDLSDVGHHTVRAKYNKFPWKQNEEAATGFEEGSRREAPRADKIISIHLGSGASITAWKDGRAIDTSMGFSPLEGLIMARRSGSLDPGILMHLLLREGLEPPALDLLLHEQSGLAAMAGHDGDMRLIMQDLVATGSKSAAGAINQYCYQIRKTIGSYIAALGGVDAISFGGGVAEHQAPLRQQIVEGLEGLGIVADANANQALTKTGAFHASTSACALYLTPVNEMDEMLRQYEVFAINK